jgi:Tol biopolymer transport system component
VDRTGHVRPLTEAFATAQGLAWSPKGEIWFTAASVGGNRSLHSVTPKGRVLERVRVPGNLTVHDASPDGRLLMTRETWRSEFVGLAPGETKERDLTWLDWSNPYAISADGKKVLFSEQGEGGGPGYSVYLRKTDGSPAVRLGEGNAQDLSPDGEWALAIFHPASDAQLALYPTGAGEPKLFSKEGLSVYNANFMPDGKQIALVAQEPGHQPRIYLRGIDGGKPRAISPEGYGSILVDPAGRWVAARGPDRKHVLIPISGGEPTPVPGMDSDDVRSQVSPDGRYFYVRRQGELPARVFRLEIATGRRELWKTLVPTDPAGVSDLGVLPTPSGEGYVYSYTRILSDLYVLDGLK